MTNINELPGMTDEDVDKLRAKNIDTVSRLWADVGKDFTNGIKNVADSVGIDDSRLFKLLADQAVREAQLNEESWLKHHWLDLTLGIMLLALAGLLTYNTLFLISPTEKTGWGFECKLGYNQREIAVMCVRHVDKTSASDGIAHIAAQSRD